MNICVIGCGECGTRITKEWSKVNKDTPTVSINSSENDHEKSVGVKYRYLINEGRAGGLAGERERVKSVLKEDPNFMNFLKKVITETDADHFILVSSTGGGTGSGCTPILADILANKLNKKVRIILVTPFEDTDLKSLENTVTCIGDIYSLDANVSIRIVSNKNVTSTGNHMTALQKVNQHIVETEEKVLSSHNLVSETTNIDKTEVSRLLFSKGYSPIYRMSAVGVKNTTDELVAKIKNSLDMSLNFDGTIERLSILSFMKESKIDMKSIREKIGEPDMCLTPLFSDDNSQEIYFAVGGANIPMEVMKYKDEFQKRQEKKKGFQTFDFSLDKKEVDKKFSVEIKDIEIQEISPIKEDKVVNIAEIDFDAFL